MKPDVFFDLDGTLTDPYEGISKSILYALERLGETPIGEAELRRCIGPPLIESFARIVGSDAATLALTYYRERFGETGWRENTVYPGIPETLQELAGDNHRLFVATSKPTVFAERIIEHFGLAEYFAGVHGSELDGTRSNKAELLKHVVRINKSTNAIMIGDREHDAKGAAKNDLPFVAVLYGYGTPAEFDAWNVSHRVRTTAEIPSAVRALDDIC